MFQRLLILITLVLVNPLLGKDIVIIGGGPAGLAAAIEAKLAGEEVIVVEKREEYTREQFVFLNESSLNLLDKWGVSIPGLIVGHDDEEKIGLTKIKYLETGLSKRINELGIIKILGEFQDLRDGSVLISQKNQTVKLPFDLLVGADGTHSSVRKTLNIDSNFLGHAFGSISIIPESRESSHMEFIMPFKSNSIFINKIIIPSATVISAQAEVLSKEMVIDAARHEGWEEALMIASDRVGYTDQIEIVLQQALQFSDCKKSVILIGDAAATGSYLQGLGAICALESATIAGLFFKSEQKESDYAAFNCAMQKITDYLIQDSLFLFSN